MNVVSKASAFPPTVQPGFPKLNELPTGWLRERIGKHLREVRRPVKMIDDKVYRLVTAKRARGGIVPREELYGRDIAVKSQFRIEEGDFLISKRQIVHGACGLVPADLDGAIVSNEYAVLRAEKTIDPRFLSYLSHSVYFQQTCFHSAIGVHIEKMIFKLDKWLKWQFDLPPLSEQKKIVEILATWDISIKTAETLLANAKQHKRALMQRLFSGNTRFSEFDGQPWRGIRLRELVEVNPRLNVCPVDYRLTFLPMDAVSEAGEIVSPVEGDWRTHLKGYTQFKDGDVLVAKITPCFENGKGCHVHGMINGVGTGSTEFHVLRPRDPRDARFVFHLVNSHEFRGRGTLNMQGSAGQRRVPPDFIRAYPFIAPRSVEEREKIGHVLDVASREINHFEQEIEKLLTEKKALMQQLLSGKRRVAT